MQGSPYVKRMTYRYDHILGYTKPGDMVVIGERVGGYETEYNVKVTLTADEARYVGQELLRIAEQIDGKNKKDRAFAKVRANTKRIAAAAKREAMG